MAMPEQFPVVPSGRRKAYAGPIAAPVLLGVTWLMVNLGFLNGGMLDPDFAIIRRAFRFNFVVFPWLAVVPGVVLILSSLYRRRPPGRSREVGLRVGIAVAAVGIGAGGLGFWMTRVEPYLRIERDVRIVSDRVTRPLLIAHISDLQSAAVGRYETRVFERLKALEPDLVLFTGDWLQPVAPASYESEIPKLLELVRLLDPPLGFYAVYGDTDAPWYRLDGPATAPVVFLGPHPYEIEWEGGLIALRGIGLYQSRYVEIGAPAVRQWADQIPSGAFAILMGHAPDFVLEAMHHGIDLCLAGHTHGGQIRIPGYGPPVIDSDVPRAWSRGFHEVGRTRLAVSAGLGCTHFDDLPGIRLFCPTEFTLITVVPPAEQIPDEEQGE